jgi:dihydroflavonol-4-reductase
MRELIERMKLNGKKILVTGGTGHLGSNLIHHLVQSLGVSPGDIRVFYPPNSPVDNIVDVPGLDLFPGDITNIESVKNAMEGSQLVWHVAGNTTFDPFKRVSQWMVNVEGTRNVLDAARQARSLERIVCTSTVNTLGAPSPPGTFGSEETSPYAPETRSVHSFTSPDQVLEFASAVHDGTAPSNWVASIRVGYFDSKLAAHELVSNAYKEQGLPIVSVLPGTFFGPRDFFIGSGTYIIQVYQNKMPGYIKTGFPLVHVHDVVRGHVLAMERGKPGERYILTGQDADNRYLGDMLGIISRVINAEEPGRKINNSLKEFRPRVAMAAAAISEAWSRLARAPCLLSKAAVLAARPISFYSNAKARRELNYEPKLTFEQAVHDHFVYFKVHGLLGVKGRRS